MIPLSLVGVRVEVPSNQPVVLLREEGGERHLPIFIGAPEATAIVYALQGMATPRPMTHDLLKTVIDDLDARVDRVEIVGLSEGTFFARVHLEAHGAHLEIDSRPSDALALAVRYDPAVPIFATEEVLDEAGVPFEATEEAEGEEGDAEEQIDEFRQFLDQITPEDFAE